MMEEKIIQIKGVDYIVSSNGRVYSTHNTGYAKYHQELSQRINSDGYMQVTVGRDGHRCQYRVHRMVAEAFIPNPHNLPEVNHKDCNRMNNCVDNLEWCTHAYNVQYAIDHGTHMSTKDLTGSNNPNYGNHKLSQVYQNNHELAKEKQSRPGANNGNAKRISLIDNVANKSYCFDYMRSAATYLIQNGFTKAQKVDSVLNRLSICAKTGKKYKNRFNVKFC